MKILYLLMITFCIINCSNSTGPETNYDYHWKVSDSPVYIDSCFTVNEEETLKIDAGVEVLFKTSEEGIHFHSDSLNVGMILVKGKIIASGSINSPIVFTRASEEGYWANITMINNAEQNIIKYCNFSFSRWFVYDELEELFCGGAITFINSTGQVESCSISNFVPFYGVHCDNSSPNIISNKIASGNIESINGERINYGSGIKCDNSSSPFIYNNVIFDGSRNIACSSESSPFILNNTLKINSYLSFGEGCVYATENSYPIVVNTLLIDIDYEGGRNCFYSTSNSSILVSYSVFIQEGNHQIFTDQGNNIETVEIDLLDGSTYRLSASSPCVNAGNSLINGVTSTDIDGNNRIVGSNIDIGAFEFQGY